MNKKTLLFKYAAHQGFHWLTIGIGAPVLILIFQSRGLNLQEIGIVVAVWVGSTAILEIPLGGVADKYGRKNTYLASLIINILAFKSLYFSTEIFTLLISASLLGSARAIYSGTLDAWFYDNFNKAEGELTYLQAISKINVIIALGLAIGATLGGWLPDFVKDSSLDFTSIYDLNIIIIIIASTALFAFTLVIINDDEKSNENTPPHKQNSFVGHSLVVIRKSLTHNVLKRLLQTLLVYGLVLSSLESFWQPYLLKIIDGTSFGVSVFGIITALYFITSSISSLASVYMVTLFEGSHRMLLFVSRTLSGLVLIALAYSDTVLTFGACYLLFFFLFTLGNNSERVLLNENTIESHRSTMLSIRSFMMTSGAVISSLLLGYVSEQYSIQANWILCGTFLAITSILFVLIPHRQYAIDICTRQK